jgi:hypothetical protein
MDNVDEIKKVITTVLQELASYGKPEEKSDDEVKKEDKDEKKVEGAEEKKSGDKKKEDDPSDLHKAFKATCEKLTKGMDELTATIKTVGERVAKLEDEPGKKKSSEVGGEDKKKEGAKWSSFNGQSPEEEDD